MKDGNIEAHSDPRDHRLPLFLLLGILLLAGGLPPAQAGVSLSFAAGNGGFRFALGYSDYPVYSPAWTTPGFSFSFESTLAGYGEWVTVAGLGRVWRPWVATGWRPYTWGRWVYTSYGWTWVAYEPWGYVPHHYGSWAMTSFGWVWVPAYVYRPANVTWITCGSYVGWYAAPPPGWSHARHTWRKAYDAGHYDGYRQGYDHGYAAGWREARYASFVPWNRMTSQNIAAVATSGSRFRQLGPGRVKVLPASPSRVRVQRALGGQAIPTVRVSERTVSMGGRTLRAVRPAGVEASIAEHSRQAVRRSLSPSIVRTFDRGARVTAPSSHTNGATPPTPSSRATRHSRPSVARRTRPMTATRNVSPRAATGRQDSGIRSSPGRASRSRVRRSSTRSVHAEASSGPRATSHRLPTTATHRAAMRSRSAGSRYTAAPNLRASRTTSRTASPTPSSRAPRRAGTTGRSASAARPPRRPAPSQQPRRRGTGHVSGKSGNRARAAVPSSRGSTRSAATGRPNPRSRRYRTTGAALRGRANP